MSKVAWIGLGVMGYPMAGHIKSRGHHDVVVFNRTKAKADAWVAEFGGTARRHPPRPRRRGLRLHLRRQRRRPPRRDARARRRLLDVAARRRGHRQHHRLGGDRP